MTRSRWTAAALAAALAALAAAPHVLPVPVQGVLVTFAVLIGPGAGIAARLSLAPAVAAAAVPAAGVSVVTLVSTAMAMTGLWQPTALLLAVAGCSLLGAGIAHRAPAAEVVR